MSGIKNIKLKFVILNDIWEKLIEKDYWKTVIYYCITEVFKSFKGKNQH